MKYFKLIGTVVALAVPSAATADTFAEIDFGLSRDWRSGNALDSSGRGLEVDESKRRKLNGVLGHAFDNGFVLQGGLNIDSSKAPAVVGFAFSDDTYRLGRQFSLQAGQTFQDYYLGAFATVGEVHFGWDDADQRTSFKSYGLQASWNNEIWSIAGTLGVLDSEADNPETLANAVMLGGAATYSWSDDTQLQFGLSYFSGEQDLDSRSAPDQVDAIVAKIEIEHTIHRSAHDRFSIYGGLSVIDVREDNGSSSFDHTRDAIVTAGVRMTFGKEAVKVGSRLTSPPLPEMLRVLGAVPAVD
ncbi:MAG: hypothetical protein JXQ85_03470 [Cognatishimia sp.]|uniref:hypothetical protein n=1 Tax=Cognatishimia sp. TaxID=2211648 RepID=UPI003B8BCBFC